MSPIPKDGVGGGQVISSPFLSAIPPVRNSEIPPEYGGRVIVADFLLPGNLAREDNGPGYSDEDVRDEGRESERQEAEPLGEVYGLGLVFE